MFLIVECSVLNEGRASMAADRWMEGGVVERHFCAQANARYLPKLTQGRHALDKGGKLYNDLSRYGNNLSRCGYDGSRCGYCLPGTLIIFSGVLSTMSDIFRHVN